MIYPDDPEGSFGPEYPKGFGWWYGAAIAALVILYWWSFS